MVLLRDYQLRAHELILTNFKHEKKVLFVAMAGAGKTITAASFIKKYCKWFNFVVVVRKRNLVEQFAKDGLETFNIDYSIFMANHPKMDLNKPIQVCSKDTMDSRDIYPFEGLDNVIMIVDEADEFPDFQRELIKRYSISKRFFYMGMTATPFNGLSHFDQVVQPITPQQLLERGVLIPFKYFIPKKLDFKDVEVRDGSFKTQDIIRKLDHNQAIADSFNAWLKYGDHRQTLIFCINKEHSKRLVQHINNYYQSEVAVHCDADTSEGDRRDAIKKFRSGEYRFLSNVRLFTRGTNIIEIGCILDCAPTLSLNLHIQKIGRGSRKNPIYNDCILIDVANNILNNGHFYQKRDIDLNSPYKKTKSDLEVQMMRVCEFCFRAAEPQEFGFNNICPYCGHRNKAPKKKKLSKYKEKKIFMEEASPEKIEQYTMINDFKKRLWKKRNLGKKYRADMARELVHIDMMKQYGLEKVLRIKRAIGLKDETIEKYKSRYEYKPLNGIS